MARPSNTAERRSQIVEGLRVAMARHGYDGATVAVIAAVAGLGPGLVHYHFESKQEILVELVRRLAASLEQRFESMAAAAGEGARARLDAFVRAHLAWGPGADPEAVACWVQIAAEAIRQPEVREVYEAQVRGRLALLTRLLAEARREAGRPSAGSEALAAGLLAAIEGCFQLGTAAPGAVPRGFAAKAVTAMVDGLLGGTSR